MSIRQLLTGLPADKAIQNRIDTALDSPSPARTLFDGVLQDARQYAARKSITAGNSVDTLFAKAVRQRLADVLSRLANADDRFRANLECAFVSGSFAYGHAYPYHRLLGRRPLPIWCERLFAVQYLYLYWHAKKHKQAVAPLWFASGMTPDLDVWLFFRESPTASKGQLFSQMQNELLHEYGLPLRVEGHMRTIDQLTLRPLLAYRTVLGESFVDQQLSSAVHAERPRLLKLYENAIRYIAANCLKPKHRCRSSDPFISSIHSQIARVIDEERAPILSIDGTSETRHATDAWHNANQAAFASFATPRSDPVRLADITGRLHDGKGQHKAAHGTICRIADGDAVRETECDGPAFVLKLRGLPEYKNDLPSRLDLIREAMTYLFLWERCKTPERHFLRPGPLLWGVPLRLDTLALQTDDVLALLLERVRPPAEAHVVTTRLRDTTDPWRFDRHIDLLQQAAATQGIEPVSRQAIAAAFRDTMVDLLDQGIVIDCCDVIVFFDQKGALIELRLFDFERLSFSALTQERHPYADLFLDLAAHLPKRGDTRQEWMAHVYGDGSGTEDPNKLARQLARTRIVRRLAHRLLHGMARCLQVLPSRFRRACWCVVIAGAGRVNRLTAKGE